MGHSDYQLMNMIDQKAHLHDKRPIRDRVRI